ncbi:MAG TPA: class II fructose-bisphosphate aldolase [Candidatus Binatia bacterium]|nr:class II fructose-bisphosphate aldolase [Candidatus Binatia bacterium]
MSIATDIDLRARLGGVATIGASGLEVQDEAALRGELMDELAFAAVFHDDEAMRDAARWIIWSASQAIGCGSASIHELYRARGRGEVPATAFTVPAINVRASTYLTARQAFAAALERDAATVIFEIAKSEMSYTDQRPAEYTAVILAAAMRSGWRSPVFLQGDHFQFNATKWAVDPDAELDGLRDLTREAVAAGFLNIDIDSSTLVDLSQPTVAEQQRVNAENTAALTRLVRELQPDGVTISVGGEIGEVGKSNSTEGELRAYLDGYLERCAGVEPISKVSIQTGTSHGGVPMPDGSIAAVSIDFDTLRRLSTVAREEYGMAGCVQHGASTLPDDAFDHFPANGTAEIHLATGFQNILYDGGGLPDGLRAEMMEWCVANCADERKEGETDEQFLYKTRKKAIGPFKRRLWTLPTAAAEEIGANLRAKFGLLFDELGIAGTRELVERHVTRVAIPRPLPSALGGEGRAAVRAGAAVFEDDGSGE